MTLKVYSKLIQVYSFTTKSLYFHIPSISLYVEISQIFTLWFSVAGIGAVYRNFIFKGFSMS